MISREKAERKAPLWLKRYTNLIIVALNIALLTCAFMLYASYTKAYDNRLRDENLGNIANLNRSAVANTATLFESWDIKLEDIALYADKHGITRDEALKIISETNSCGDRHFELIGSDYKGCAVKQSADGSYAPLDYTNSSYTPLQKAFDDTKDEAYNGINFAPEYTDAGETATKRFAIYKHISLKNDEGVSEPYTLLLSTSSQNVHMMLNDHMDYEGQSTALIDAAGNYIVSNRDFKSTNFFQYLYVYNDLTLDRKNAIRSEMEHKGAGELYYKNAGAVVEDCVFRYERMPDNGWYCITCVPISSFHAAAINTNYIVYAIAMILVLLVVDIIWLQGMNRRLRVSMLREKEAGAAKGNFMSRMSHEIRTPLNAVIGYNTIARNEMTAAKTDGERRQAEMKMLDCLVKSDIASKHLLTIINDVLDMSAIESGKIKVAHDRFDFRSLITSLTTVFYTQARLKDVEFDVVLCTLTEEWFTGDQMRTSQILTNLLSNSIKFTPEGGKVTLEIIQPEAEVNAAHIRFKVTDTGIGMSEEYLSHIWTPFEQADSSISRRFGGTGLGLSITKNLVELMNGSISVESKMGEGTTFTVDLTFERTEQIKNADTYDFGSVNALVVDDDASTCDYIKLLFNRCGARCVAVTSGQAAVEAVRVSVETGNLYTVCLVDWHMPEVDGIETVRRIREVSKKDIPMIVLTAYDYTELADKAADMGISKFLSKPLFQSSLFDLLANVSGVKRDKPIERSRSFDFSGAHVLLAEDNAMNMEIAKSIMESAGISVHCAWNGREAVRMFEESPAGEYMAIFMDVHMPEMNGHDAARAIRASSHPEAKTIPIIAMTADAFAENVAEAREAGMNGHIAKPINIPVLFETLKEYYDGN